MASIDNIVNDAERLVLGGVPIPFPTTRLPQILAVVVKHLEQLAGHELESLADEVLGVHPTVVASPPPGPGAPTGPTPQDLERRIVELEARLKSQEGPTA